MEGFLLTYIMILVAVLMTMMVTLLPLSIYMDWKREQQAQSRRETAPAKDQVTPVRRVRSITT